MSEDLLVTIGLPVYNSEKYLPQSIESLLSQTYEDFVLVISDNASTDGTAEICKSYAARDSRIKYYRNEENIGNPRNFNRVFELTETRYLKWSTADDYCGLTFVEKALDIMENDPSIILCYPKTTIVDMDGKNPQEYEDNLHLVDDDPVIRYKELFPRIGLAHQHLGLIRTSLARQTHLLRTHVASDINFLGEMALYGKIYELPERLFYRRFHPKSGSWKRGSKKHQAKFYHGARSAPERFKHWRSHYANFASVFTAPLSMRQKFTLVRWLVWRFCAQYRKLGRDILDYGRSVFS